MTTLIRKFCCPHCQSEAHPNARACRACGAPFENGPVPEIELRDGLGLPDEDDFDYERFVDEEFGEGAPRFASFKQLFWWATAVITLIAFVFLVFSGVF